MGSPEENHRAESEAPCEKIGFARVFFVREGEMSGGSGPGSECPRVIVRLPR